MKKPNLPQIYPSAARPSFSLKRPAAFRALLTKGLALSGIRFFNFLIPFIWRAFKIFKSEERFENADGSDFQEENSNLYRKPFKGLSPSTTPFGKRKLCWLLQINNTKSD